MQMPSRKSFLAERALASENVHSTRNSSCESSLDVARELVATSKGRFCLASSIMSLREKSSLLSSFTTLAVSRRSSPLPLMTSTVNSTSNSSGPSKASPAWMFGREAWMDFWMRDRSLSFLSSGRCRAMATMPSCMPPKPTTSSIVTFLPRASWKALLNSELARRSESGSTTSSAASQRKLRSFDLAVRKLASSSSCRRTSSASSRARVNSTAMEPALCVLLPARRSARTSMSSGA
mmetsp:Transcript_85324/g.249773  ORF Transcript_85324/g.249773 Transcript_85324/m.249773 type:complete len:236 (-) Transcript_85324:221-928(-)